MLDQKAVNITMPNIVGMTVAAGWETLDTLGIPGLEIEWYKCTYTTGELIDPREHLDASIRDTLPKAGDAVDTTILVGVTIAGC